MSHDFAYFFEICIFFEFSNRDFPPYLSTHDMAHIIWVSFESSRSELVEKESKAIFWFYPISGFYTQCTVKLRPNFQKNSAT